MSTDLLDTSQLCVTVIEEEGFILLNFYWSIDSQIRWFWSNRKGQPIYEIAEWHNTRPLFEQIDRLWANGVLLPSTAAAARSLVMWERDKCRMRAIKSNRLGIWNLIQYLFVR